MVVDKWDYNLLNFIVCELEKIGVHEYHFTKRWATSSRALSAQTGEQDGG